MNQAAQPHLLLSLNLQQQKNSHDFPCSEIPDGYQFDSIRIAELNSGLLAPAYLAGVDEAGRGPLAGPVVAAAVVLPSSPLIFGLRDSKIIPPEQREALYCEIMETALAVEVCVIDPQIIDQINILEATLLAMRNCIQKLSVRPSLALIDGNQFPQSGLNERAVVRGDSLSAAIMAASIVAKVTRDQIMIEAHDLFPHYGFDEHKGYGSSRHIEAIKRHGPSPLHRKSFEPIKSMLCLS